MPFTAFVPDTPVPFSELQLFHLTWQVHLMCFQLLPQGHSQIQKNLLSYTVPVLNKADKNQQSIRCGMGFAHLALPALQIGVVL